MLPWLVDDLVEEVLLRLPPHEPASLVRAALVCRRWRRLVSDAGFRRRFREFHRSPPVLGMLCNRADIYVPRFVPTTAFCTPEADRSHRHALDARHGRVLLQGKGCDDVVVWDPITDEERMLPSSPHRSSWSSWWTAAVLCAAAAAGAGAGACDHLDCHRGPFVVVLLWYVIHGPDAGKTFVCTYASKTDAWTEPVYTDQPEYPVVSVGSTLVGNALYFKDFSPSGFLKYNLESHEISWILLPSSLPLGRRSVLIATENAELGLATKQGSMLCIWLWKQDDACEAGGEWQKPSRAINLETLLPADAFLSKLDVVGSAEGLGIIFMSADDVVYTIDLKTCKVKVVYNGEINTIIPYMSFYTPALEAACIGGGEPSVGGSSA